MMIAERFMRNGVKITRMTKLTYWYVKGQEDCAQGNDHNPTIHPERQEEYDEGYAEQYALEQQLTHRSEIIEDGSGKWKYTDKCF